jgi:integrase
LICPECGSSQICKAGLRYLADGSKLQRFLCNNCHIRFSETNPFKPSRTNSNHRLSAVLQEAKKLDSTAEIKTVVGEKKYNEIAAIAKGKILELCLYMKRQGYKDEYIRLNRIALKVLHERGADLFDEDSVKDVISRQKWSDNRRRNVINAYDMFVKLNNLSWDKPRCIVATKIPFIPSEKEIDALISAAGKKLSAFLLLLKETAMRRGEAKRLEWINVDSERNTITLNEPEKRSNPRMWKVTPRLIAQLNALPKNSQKVFGNSSIDSMKSMFLTLRKKLATKLQNPRFKKINFHSFRHWKATTLYHKTKDPYYVKNFLGHKSLKNTEIYITVEHTLFGEGGNDEFTVKVAEDPKEIKSLLEVGFECVCQKDTLIFLRKRK